MSEIPEGLRYTAEHEWLRVEGDLVAIGITDHAQDALTDIVYIELPAEGDTMDDMGEFAVVESVKSASRRSSASRSTRIIHRRRHCLDQI